MDARNLSAVPACELGNPKEKPAVLDGQGSFDSRTLVRGAQVLLRRVRLSDKWKEEAEICCACREAVARAWINLVGMSRWLWLRFVLSKGTLLRREGPRTAVWRW